MGASVLDSVWGFFLTDAKIPIYQLVAFGVLFAIIGFLLRRNRLLEKSNAKMQSQIGTVRQAVATKPPTGRIEKVKNFLLSELGLLLIGAVMLFGCNELYGDVVQLARRADAATLAGGINQTIGLGFSAAMAVQLLRGKHWFFRLLGIVFLAGAVFLGYSVLPVFRYFDGWFSDTNLLYFRSAMVLGFTGAALVAISLTGFLRKLGGQ